MSLKDTTEQTTHRATPPAAGSSIEASPWDEGSAASGKGRDKFRLYTLSELAKLRQPGWLIPDILPDRGISILYGAPGSGKSFIALDWALTIARGGQWAGRPVAKGLVVYVAAEGAYGYPPRIQAWHMANAPGGDGDSGDASIYFLSEPVPLGNASDTDEDDFSVFYGKLDALGEPPALIIFDTLSRCLAGEDENSTKALSTVVKKVEALAARFHCSVLLVHHTRRKDDEIRGSGVLAGAANMMASVKQYKRREIVELRCTKMKDSPEFDGYDFEFAALPISTVLTMVASGKHDVADDSEDEELNTVEQSVLDALEDGMAFPRWIERAMDRTEADGVPRKAGAVRKIANRLISEGYVRQEGTRGHSRCYRVNDGSADGQPDAVDGEQATES